MSNQLWIEPVGDLLIARIRGVPTEAILRECQERLLVLMRDTRRGLILHDCLEMEAPPVEVPLSQWNLDTELKLADVTVRRAIVVPNTKLAYLARLAFGEGDYRVFYNDMTSAVSWLGHAGRERVAVSGASAIPFSPTASPSSPTSTFAPAHTPSHTPTPTTPSRSSLVDRGEA